MIDVRDVAKKVGLSALFLALWAYSAFCVNAFLLIFLGLVSLPLSGFGFPHPSTPDMSVGMSAVVTGLYVITTAIAVAVGAYFSALMIICRNDIDEFNKRFELIGRIMVWMMLTILFGFMSMFVVIVVYAFSSGITSGTDEAFTAIVHEARFALLAALIGAGEYARRELIRMENEPKEANEDDLYY